MADNTVQFEDYDVPYYQNMVCSLHYSKARSNQKFELTTSCGQRELSTFSGKLDATDKVRYDHIIGEDPECPNPWFRSQDLTGFITEHEEKQNIDRKYAICSYYRYFESPDATQLKVGDSLLFIAGYNHYESARTAGAKAFGHSDKLTFVILDNAVQGL